MPFQSHLRDFSTAKQCGHACGDCPKRQPHLITALRRVVPESLTCQRSRVNSSLADVNLGAEREALSDGRL